MMAEQVLPGHPDRLADALAERIVDCALAMFDRSFVGVEVAVFQQYVYLTGRVVYPHLAGDQWLLPPRKWKGPRMRARHRARLDEAALWADTLAAAGVVDDWATDDWQIESRALIVEPPEDFGLGRDVSDDQNIVIGYACGDDSTRYLPPATYLARKLRDALVEAQKNHATRLGPDGKLLVHIAPTREGYRWVGCNIAIQHAPDVAYSELYALLRPAITEASTCLPGLA
ncbi:MAG: hypothetical protein ACLFTK_17220, partial [Anaerolineales bacterium]